MYDKQNINVWTTIAIHRFFTMQPGDNCNHWNIQINLNIMSIWLKEIYLAQK